MVADSRTDDPAPAVRLRIPEGYEPSLDVRTTERAVETLRRDYQHRLAAALDLDRPPQPPGQERERGGQEESVPEHVRNLEGLAAHGGMAGRCRKRRMVRTEATAEARWSSK